MACKCCLQPAATTCGARSWRLLSFCRQSSRLAQHVWIICSAELYATNKVIFLFWLYYSLGIFRHSTCLPLWQCLSKGAEEHGRNPIHLNSPAVKRHLIFLLEVSTTEAGDQCLLLKVARRMYEDWVEDCLCWQASFSRGLGNMANNGPQGQQARYGAQNMAGGLQQVCWALWLTYFFMFHRSWFD